MSKPSSAPKANPLQERLVQLVKVRDEMITQREQHLREANALGERILIQSGAIGELNLIINPPTGEPGGTVSKQ